ncbi:elongin c [Cystoisospora suis]|uniref:Elongin-C n=1 Tax=Cystoisospora suis TaxID=483139 RepID=A0A2C6KY42_9APIC|nr:elongin c [Cystoisospora suis]
MAPSCVSPGARDSSTQDKEDESGENTSCEVKEAAQAAEESSVSENPKSKGSAEASKQFVQLVGAEGKPLLVEREIAEECELFRKMLSTDLGGKCMYSEGVTGEIKLPSLRHRILQKVVDYLRFRKAWNEEGGRNAEFQVESDIALELMLAANYLGLTDEDHPA